MVTAPLIVADLRGAFVGPLSMIVEQGSCAAIAGPSGSGKSLLLRMIADLDPSDGEIHLGPMRRNAMTAPDWRRMIMYVASEAGWWAPDARSHVPREATEPAARLCTRLGLGAEHLDRPISTLSTGERQRLALVRALVRRPKALLLDEPTSALDPASVALVESVLGDAIADGLILVVVSHDAEQARRLGTRRYAMQAGRLTEA